MVGNRGMRANCIILNIKPKEAQLLLKALAALDSDEKEELRKYIDEKLTQYVLANIDVY